MRTVLVTGFAVNIGKKIAEIFLEHDYYVVGVNCPYTVNAANDFISSHPNSCSFTADFTSVDSVTQLLSQLKLYSYDAIVNNAGMISLREDGQIRHEFYDFSYEQFSNVMRCNFDTPLRICLELKECINDGGSIVNIASGGGMRASYATLSYAASKAALINLTASLSNNFYPYRHVRVNSISPGWVNPDSEGGMGVAENTPGGKAGKLTALGRNASTKEIANVVYFLTTSEASFINGSNIVVDGGWLNHNLIYLEEATGREMLRI
jgi:NAD(P)-dependent dehydrogenase (short-subunit alcohol dehydrogenase family)